MTVQLFFITPEGNIEFGNNFPTRWENHEYNNGQYILSPKPRDHFSRKQFDVLDYYNKRLGA